MFGESESESPRVPSPWDSLSPSPSPPPPSHQILPRLPPESDLGNVEYKLQLLSPSTSRFTRLVTQLKWRLLEGGGQAYYELGVSDSGLLVGLTRGDLETSLETLEMMAGEIGASVIVVKEVEVPGRMAEMARKQEDYRRRGERGFYVGSAESTTSTSTVTTETETEIETEQDESLSTSASASPSLLPTTATCSDATDLFSMDPDTDSETTTVVSLSLEISSVFKPRPVRTRMQLSSLNSGHTRRRDAKKEKWKEKETKQVKWKEKNKEKVRHEDKEYVNNEEKDWKSTNRRLARDRRREEKRKALVAAATESLATREMEAESAVNTVITTSAITTTTTSAVEPDIPPVPSISLTTPTSAEPPILTNTTTTTTSVSTSTSTSLLPEESPFLLTLEGGDDDDDDDVFPTPSIPHKHFVTSTTSTSETTPLSASQQLFNDIPASNTTLRVPVPVAGFKMFSHNKSTGEVNADGPDEEGLEADLDPRYIVEALVVRKMSLEEAFLDFGGFSITDKTEP
ncbi:hypothetical protein VKT23_010323 [Stygiomarasmius scandens]|uniref:Uncharacterized protein n=1 Tax=Marasmiellus scandens TaxID=2682957 RepID=A0ABR1JCA0_9AGAR